ncbi:hypothetical protein BGP89_14065 [Luteimonas sp. JM171]|nr:hypothetical protein [Luteimonas sp. JM171]
MCGLLPCEFWRLVVVFPGYALTFAYAAGFLAGVFTLSAVQAWRARRG